VAQPATNEGNEQQEETGSAQTQYKWNLLPNSPVASSRTDDIWFFDELTGWLVNSSGYVCKTEDGGASWVPKFFLYPNLPSKPYLRCMGWANRQYGWFGAVTGIHDAQLKYPSQYIRTLLHHTKDGGETWEPVMNLPEGSPAGICGFYAVNERVVYGSGTNDPGLPGPAIIKTTDGGASWELIDMQPYADNLIDIYFFDENRGIVVGGKIHSDCPKHPAGYPPPRLSRYAQLKPVVLRTYDGGKTWSNTAAGTQGLSCGEWGWKIQFLNEKIGFVSLENFVSAAILKTTDGGESWTRYDVKDSEGNIINNDLEGIGFMNENQGWVGGWGYNFQGYMNSYTEDGGETWVRQDHDPCDSNSDPRLRINRYRLFTEQPKGGYCSGLQVYKLAIGSPKKAAFAKSSAFAKTAFAGVSDERVEPAHGGQAKSAAFAASTVAGSLQIPEHGFDLSCEQTPDGKVKISYSLPEDAKNVFIGLWNQFAFHVRTLISGRDQGSGRQTVIWDGKDDQGNAAGAGVFICRMCTDGEQGASVMIELPQPA